MWGAVACYRFLVFFGVFHWHFLVLACLLHF